MSEQTLELTVEETPVPFYKNKKFALVALTAAAVVATAVYVKFKMDQPTLNVEETTETPADPSL